MFEIFSRRKSLDGLGVTTPSIAILKNQYEIAILDDEPFLRSETLKNHGFRIRELGGDIKSIDQIAAYPIIVCDIRGVGKSFGSTHEGAHVISEIKKSYPDKYIVAYTGSTYDATYNEKLALADKVAVKDTNLDGWITYLEDALVSIGDPKKRWLRLRASLLQKGVDIYDVHLLEQAFIKSIGSKNSGIFSAKAKELDISSDVMDLIIKFSVSALAQLIGNI